MMVTKVENFKMTCFLVGVSHKAEVNRFVRMLKAVDDDAGLNGTLSYSIRASNLFTPGEQRKKEAVADAAF